MKTWTLGLLVAGALLATPTAGTHASDDKSDGDGRYEGVAASENAVWVIDTRSGKVRKCTQELADQTPKCSSLSN